MIESQDAFSSFFEGLHNILILLIIVIIIALQIKVFINVKRRISYYKNVVPNFNEFKTDKIYLTESEIAKLPLEKIYSDLQTYKTRVAELTFSNTTYDYENLENFDVLTQQNKEAGNS